MAQGVFECASSLLQHKLGQQLDWHDPDSQKALSFYVPLDPYLSTHRWGMYGNDNASVQAQYHVNGHSTISPSYQPPHLTTLDSSQEDPHFSVQQFDNSPGLASPLDLFVQSHVPPSPLLAPELVERIASNRAQALQRRNAKRVREVQSHPVRHVEPDEQVVDQRVMPLLLASHLTTSHRNKFAFGRVTAGQARHHMAASSCGPGG